MAWASAVDTRMWQTRSVAVSNDSTADAHLVQVDRVGDVAKLGCAEVADHCPEALGGRGDLARHEQLAGLGLPCDAGSQVHRGSVVVAFEGDGTPVVGAGTGEEYGLWCRDLSLDELLECDHCVSRCRKSEHDGVADRLDELVVGTEHLLGAGAERLDDRDGFAVAVGLGDGGEAGEVDEGERGVEVGRGHVGAPTPISRT